MRPLSLFAIVLIIAGIAGLVVENVSWTEKEKVVDVGPIQVESEEKHNLPIPTIAGVIAVIAGIGLLVIDRRAA